MTIKVSTFTPLRWNGDAIELERRMFPASDVRHYTLSFAGDVPVLRRDHASYKMPWMTTCAAIEACIKAGLIETTKGPQ